MRQDKATIGKRVLTCDGTGAIISPPEKYKQGQNYVHVQLDSDPDYSQYKYNIRGLQALNG